jgi:hypothetical protein
MDLLFRLSKQVDGFSNMEETKSFFELELPVRDDNYFYDVKKNRQLEKGDTIYFVYDGYIVQSLYFKAK